jgi:hypothetical protein
LIYVVLEKKPENIPLPLCGTLTPENKKLPIKYL